MERIAVQMGVHLKKLNFFTSAIFLLKNGQKPPVIFVGEKQYCQGIIPDAGEFTDYVMDCMGKTTPE